MSETALTPEQEAELEQLALEDTKLAAEAEAIDERRRQIKATLRDRLPRGTHHLGAHTVTIKTPARRLNMRRLAEAFPVAGFPEVWSATIDAAKVRERVAPFELDPFFDEGVPVVEVK